jgi:hypothetical protein
MTKEELKALANEIARQMQWPEIMELQTAGRYIDRGPEAVRHLIRNRLIPRVVFDSKVQVRRSDIDKFAENNLR